MIDVEKVHNNYYIKFNGTKEEFNYYINKVMSIKDKEYDFEKECWKLSDAGFNRLKLYFDDININSLTDYSTISKKEITDYQNIGSMMKLKPYDYQKQAIKFCLDGNEGNLLVLPCGAGKTVIGIGAFLEAKKNNIINGPGLIVVKASLKVQWLKEVKKFSNLKANIIYTEKEYNSSLNQKIKNRESKLKKINDKKEIKTIKKEINNFKKEKEKNFNKQFKGYDLYILNYETLRDEYVQKYLNKYNIDFIYADEIQYVKNHKAVRSKALYNFANVKLKIGATATPITKGPKDIYGIFKLLEPKLFPTWTSFQRKYIEMKYMYGRYQETGRYTNLNDLKETIDPYMFVKTKEEISDQLPSLVVMQKYCNLTSQQNAMTEQIKKEIDELSQTAYEIRAKLRTPEKIEQSAELAKVDGQIMALQTFAQELANTEELLAISDSQMAKKYITGSKSSKLELLIDLIEEILDSGEKVAIFSRYERMQGIITNKVNDKFKKNKEYKDLKIAYINGSINSQSRYDAIQRFSNDDDHKILLLSDAGAEGINLSTCKYLIEFDLADSYSRQTQRHGRIERADSIHDTVFVYQLIANDSWDEIAQKIIDKKEGYDYELIKKGL